MKETYKNIVILGGGESGVGAAILAQKNSAEVFLTDSGALQEKYREDLRQYGIEFEEGGHTMERVVKADLIIKSPGIPHKAPIIQEAYRREIPVVSEIEYASWYTDARIIGITGTNGKTTTTSLTYHILKEAGLNVGLGGNIGKSFARSVAEDSFDIYVLEISSFQLDDIRHYRNFIGVLLNITPDHLDRYEYSLEKYIRSKFKIADNQMAEDYFIYNADDPITVQYLEKFGPHSRLLPISQEGEVFPGAYILDDELHIGINHKEEITMSMDDSSLKGKHNRYNTMAAGVVSKILELRKDVIRESMKNFQNVEHRLEPVANVGEVDYINDSKATNVNSTWYALESIRRPIVWIAGGIDKGNDYDTLKPLVKERVRALVCLGKDNSRLREEFQGEIRTLVETSSMEDAVHAAYELAKPGDVVLLSPACSSFDLFQNYEDRGTQFKQEVARLTEAVKQ